VGISSKEEAQACPLCIALGISISPPHARTVLQKGRAILIEILLHQTKEQATAFLQPKLQQWKHFRPSAHHLLKHTFSGAQQAVPPASWKSLKDRFMI